MGDFPEKEYLIDLYADRTGFNLSAVKWYESFAYWKNSVVLQQLYKRFHDGATKDPRMAKLGIGAMIFAKVAHAKAKQI